VKEWVGEGWMRWKRDKPDWFTDNWKARVPSDWVPKEGKEEWDKARKSVMGGKPAHNFAAERQKFRAHQEDVGGILEGDSDDERSTAQAVRGGSRVQPVIR
jgi:hypothetical protein